MSRGTIGDREEALSVRKRERGGGGGGGRRQGCVREGMKHERVGANEP